MRRRRERQWPKQNRGGGGEPSIVLPQCRRHVEYKESRGGVGHSARGGDAVFQGRDGLCRGKGQPDQQREQQEAHKERGESAGARAFVHDAVGHRLGTQRQLLRRHTNFLQRSEANALVGIQLRALELSPTTRRCLHGHLTQLVSDKHICGGRGLRRLAQHAPLMLLKCCCCCSCSLLLLLLAAAARRATRQRVVKLTHPHICISHSTWPFTTVTQPPPPFLRL